MKRTLCLLITIVLTFSLCSCDIKHNEQEQTPSKYETGGINHGVISPDPLEENFTLEYQGNEISLTYMLENGKSENSWGLSIYLNGFQQPFSIDGKEKTVVYIDEYKPSEIKTVNISFEPVCGKTGDVLSVVFVAMVCPDYVISAEDDNERYGNFHSISQMPWRIHFLSDSSNNVSSCNDFILKELDEEFRSHYVVSSEDSESNLLDSNIYFELFDEEQTINGYKTLQNGNLKLFITGAGRNPFKNDTTYYRISVYIDHNLISCFDGESYLTIPIKNNKISSAEFEIPSTLIKENSHLYMIAVPITQPNISDGTLPILKPETKQIIHSKGV